MSQLSLYVEINNLSLDKQKDLYNKLRIKLNDNIDHPMHTNKFNVNRCILFVLVFSLLFGIILAIMFTMNICIHNANIDHPNLDKCTRKVLLFSILISGMLAMGFMVFKSIFINSGNSETVTIYEND